MAATTFPLGRLVDDAGAVLDAPVVTVSSVVDKAGVAVASHGATVNGSGTDTPISVDYDAEAKGEAWITLAVSQATKTVTGERATRAIFATAERSQVAAALAHLSDATIALAPDTLSGVMSVYRSGQAHTVGNLLYTVELSRASTGQPFSFDRV